jgi:hypothetical protein
METMSDYHTKALSEALRRVAASPVLAALADHAAQQAGSVAALLQQAVLTEVPEFSQSRNPDLLPQLARHGTDHIEEILRLLRGGRLGGLEFVHEHARRRAEQHFPMAATLHAYRSGHKVLSRWLRESALSVVSPAADARLAIATIADFAMEYTDAISTAFAGTYSSHSLLLADVAGDQRSQLLQILLAGQDEADPGTARILRDAGFLEERQFFCVALARSVDPMEMLDAARARRLADAVERLFAESPVRRVIDVRDNKVAMVFADPRRSSGWTAERSSLSGRTSATLMMVGNAALVGISNDVPSTSHVPAAYREAVTALELASVSERVVRFADIPLRRLLLHFARQDFGRVVPAWAGAFIAADDKANGALVGTLRAYASVDMNILKSAELLRLHPNTVYARLQRILEITGLQARSFDGLADLLVVCDFVHRGVVGTSGSIDRTPGSGSPRSPSG